MTEPLSHRIIRLQGLQFNNQKKEKKLTALGLEQVKLKQRLNWENQKLPMACLSVSLILSILFFIFPRKMSLPLLSFHKHGIL